jgi:hypothetical protein
VYMELPSNIADLDIEVPTSRLMLADPPSDPERLSSCIAAIAGRFCAAKSPAILVDADAGRFGVASDLMELAEKMQAPVAVINTAKSVIDETFPHYLGIYIGKASEPRVREAIETSDCLLAIGYRPIEVTTGDTSPDSLPANTIHARGHSVDVGDDNYQAVTLKEMLKGVIDAVPQVRHRAPRPVAAAVARTRADGSHADPFARLTQAAYWQAMQGYLKEGDVLFVDNGTSYALFGLKFPAKCTFVGSVNWGSIGYSVGALLGSLMAAPERRHILFVGDGSFQVTAQELSTILRHDHKPGDFPDQQRRLHDRTRLSRQDRELQRHRQLVVCRPAKSVLSRYPGAIVCRQDRQGSAKRPQRSERHDDLRRIHHGPVRRSRAGLEQQQQGCRPRLRTSRAATPRQPAPASHIGRLSQVAVSIISDVSARCLRREPKRSDSGGRIAERVKRCRIAMSALRTISAAPCLFGHLKTPLSTSKNDGDV